MRRWALLLVVAGCNIDEWPAMKTTGPTGSGSIGAIRALSVNRQNACVVTMDGKLYCWGDNGSGQLGADPTKVFWSDAGKKNAQVSNAAAPAVDDNGTICILDTTGAVQCLGSAQALGDGTATARSTIGPAMIAGVTALGGGDGFCAVSSGVVSCWGAGSAFNPGYLKPRPTALTGPSGVTALFAGGDHGCAIATGGQLWCWGSDAYGQLGDGQCTMTLVGVVQSGSLTATEVGVTAEGTCTLAGGSISCFGAPVVPNGSSCTTAPVAFTGVTGAQHIVGGDSFFCTLDAQGAVACWGDNSAGQLGTTPGAATATPQTVAGLGTAKLLAAGGMQACAVTSDDKVYCWGQDNGTPRAVTQILFE